MAQSKVLHYASYEAPHEGDNCEYWSLTACGHDYDNVTHYEDSVTCKNCLREINKSNKSKKMTPNDKLPEETYNKVLGDAVAYDKERKMQVAYYDGATAWAEWKVRFDELQAQAQCMADALGLLVSRFEGAAEMADQDIDTRIIKDCKKLLQQFKDRKESVGCTEKEETFEYEIRHINNCYSEKKVINEMVKKGYRLIAVSPYRSGNSLYFERRKQRTDNVELITNPK